MGHYDDCNEQAAQSGCKELIEEIKSSNNITGLILQT